MWNIELPSKKGNGYRVPVHRTRHLSFLLLPPLAVVRNPQPLTAMEKSVDYPPNHPL